MSFSDFSNIRMIFYFYFFLSKGATVPLSRVISARSRGAVVATCCSVGPRRRCAAARCRVSFLYAQAELQFSRMLFLQVVTIGEFLLLKDFFLQKT